jgi:hypothetical protein
LGGPDVPMAPDKPPVPVCPGGILNVGVSEIGFATSNPPPGTAQFGRVKSDSLRPFLARACDHASEGEEPEAINLEASDST